MSTRGVIAIFNEQSGWTLPETHVDRLKATAGDRLELSVARSRPQLLDMLPDAECLIGFPLNENPLMLAPNLRWVQLTQSAGSAIRVLEQAMHSGLVVTSAEQFRAPQIAEHAIAMLLALTRRLNVAMSSQADHEWASETLANRMGTLAGSSVGVIASGTVGGAIAQRLKAFGARVLATRRDANNPYMNVDEVFPPDQLDEMIMRVHALIVAVPLVGSTTHLLHKRRLSRMKRDAVLVDVSRGGVVDQTALLDMLRKGRLSGAALDVFEHEPLPPTSPFYTMPSVIVTPHVAAASPHYWDQACAVISRNITRFLDNQPMSDRLSEGWIKDAAPA
ncbi:MAG: D-2-hydroxyacid dehydrogenase [Planctomycetota bacterium]